MADEPIPFLLLRLQARAQETSKWIDIWPAQFEGFLKLGYQFRIIELSPGDPAKYIVTEAMALAGVDMTLTNGAHWRASGSDQRRLAPALAPARCRASPARPIYREYNPYR